MEGQNEQSDIVDPSVQDAISEVDGSFEKRLESWFNSDQRELHETSDLNSGVDSAKHVADAMSKPSVVIAVCGQPDSGKSRFFLEFVNKYGIEDGRQIAWADIGYEKFAELPNKSDYKYLLIESFGLIGTLNTAMKGVAPDVIVYLYRPENRTEEDVLEKLLVNKKIDVLIENLGARKK